MLHSIEIDFDAIVTLEIDAHGVLPDASRLLVSTDPSFPVNAKTRDFPADKTSSNYAGIFTVKQGWQDFYIYRPM